MKLRECIEYGRGRKASNVGECVELVKRYSERIFSSDKLGMELRELYSEVRNAYAKGLTSDMKIDSAEKWLDNNRL